jgi:hypothetical protein
MELASMLAGERFSDRPASVCPIVAALLRAYNDHIDDERRADLYRYAAEAVGTRGEFGLQLRRARVVVSWARATRLARAHGFRSLSRQPEHPTADAGPESIARYVIGALGPRRRGRDGAPGGWSDTVHASVLGLIDLLIGLGAEARIAPAEVLHRQPEPVPVPEFDFEAAEAELGFDPLALGELVEQLAEPLEDRGGDPQLVG